MQTHVRDDGFATANPSFESLEFEDDHGQFHLDILRVSIVNRYSWPAAF